MAKYGYAFDESKIKRFIKEGRGQGQGKDYKPWLTAHDVPSIGRITRVTGWRTGRIHHFLSDHETRLFYLLEWSNNVVDIREQFPLLERDITQRIVQEMGVRHPTDPSTGIPLVITTDVLISLLSEGKIIEVARTVKPADQLNNLRVIEKLEIERRYWEAKGVDWGIVTEKEIPKILAKNIEVIHPFYWLEATAELDVPHLLSLASKLKKRLQGSTASIIQITDNLDVEMNLSEGTSLYLFKHLVARKEILLDMSKKLNFTQPAREIKKIIFEVVRQEFSA
jgi:hypothetical protein